MLISLWFITLYEVDTVSYRLWLHDLDLENTGKLGNYSLYCNKSELTYINKDNYEKHVGQGGI
jgi:hypothetical protein